MKRFTIVFMLLALFATAVSAAPGDIHFDPPREEPFMNCAFNSSKAPNCLSGNFTANASEMEANDFNASTSWCNNGSYYNFNGVDSITYENTTSMLNISNATIVIGFTPQNVTKFGGIVSMFDRDILGGGWTLRTLDTGGLGFRFVNGSNDTSYTFNDNGFSTLQNNENYTLVITLDGDYIHVWLNNVQIERQGFIYTMSSNATAKLRLGYYNSTSINRFQGQIHFFYFYNYSVSYEQAANRTRTICGSDLHPINSTRNAVWPLTNTTGPDWSNTSSNDRPRDAYDYRTFSDHASGIDFHRGIDLSNVSGLPVMSVMNGTVVRAETDEEVNGTGRARFGNWVMVEHSPDPDTGQPRHSLYFHMNDTPIVTEGDNVTAGQILGLTGRTGYQINTQHLHFEISRDLDEDRYSNRRVIHPYNGLNYSNINATTLSIASNTTHFIFSIYHNITDADLVAVKLVGIIANRTVNYQTKEGLNLSDPDQKCYQDICFEPQDTVNPFSNYTVNYTVPRAISGPLLGAAMMDVSDVVQIFEIVSWPVPTIVLNKTVSATAMNVSEFITYNISLALTGDAAYNITLTENFSSSVRYNSSSLAPLSDNSTFVIANISPGDIYRFNITVQALNVSNNTIAFNNVNITYYNFTGTSAVANATVNTTIYNPSGTLPYNFTNISVSKADNADPVNVSTVLNYTITITSTGTGTALNVTMNETYPPEVRFVSATPSPVTGTNTTFNIGNITAGGVYVVNISVLTLNVTGTINNTANVSFVNETGYRSNVSDNEVTVVENSTVAESSPGTPASSSGGGGSGGISNVTAPVVVPPAPIVLPEIPEEEPVVEAPAPVEKSLIELISPHIEPPHFWWQWTMASVLTLMLTLFISHRWKEYEKKKYEVVSLSELKSTTRRYRP